MHDFMKYMIVVKTGYVNFELFLWLYACLMFLQLKGSEVLLTVYCGTTCIELFVAKLCMLHMLFIWPFVYCNTAATMLLRYKSIKLPEFSVKSATCKQSCTCLHYCRALPWSFHVVFDSHLTFSDQISSLSL